MALTRSVDQVDENGRELLTYGTAAFPIAFFDDESAYIGSEKAGRAEFVGRRVFHAYSSFKARTSAGVRRRQDPRGRSSSRMSPARSAATACIRRTGGTC